MTVHARLAGRQDAPLEDWENTREWVTSVHQGNVDQQVELLHHCWRLAYVDDLRRVLSRHGLDERAFPGVWDRANNLEIGDDSTNALLGTWQNYIKHGRTQLQACGGHTVVRPTFIPGFAVGDLVLGTTIIDVKFTHDPEETLGYCLKQVLAYALSEGGNAHGIDAVGVYHAREAHLQTWTLDGAIEAIATESVELQVLREMFSAAVEAEQDRILTRRRSGYRRSE